MSITTTTTEKVTAIASQTVAAAGAASGSIEAKEGGLVSVRIKNGPTGPTTPGTVNVFISHEATAAAVGSLEWKQYGYVQGSTVSNQTVDRPIAIPRCKFMLFVAAGGNQPTTVEVVGTVDAGFTSV